MNPLTLEATVKERPILFYGPMVRAILEGRKTQTRRIVLNGGRDADYNCECLKDGRAYFRANRKPKRRELLMPYFSVPCRFDAGMRLWVRETWGPSDGGICYRASEADSVKPDDGRWHPAIHMFRDFSRLTLEIVSVRVERLQCISDRDADAEGTTCHYPCTEPTHLVDGQHRCNPVGDYKVVWDSINGKNHPWKSNPWVWVIEFKKL